MGKRLCDLVLLLAGLLSASGSHAQLTATADEVKAAFIYQFAAFVEWPEARSSDASFTIGVAGGARIEDELRRFSLDRKVGERPVRVVEVRSARDAEDVHILFLGKSFQGDPTPLIREALGRHVLVVTDLEGGLDHGSIINFDTRERVRFEISTAAAQRAGLRLSSRLLAVALRLRKGELDEAEPLYA